jgi:excisionase family DNA binding protein
VTKRANNVAADSIDRAASRAGASSTISRSQPVDTLPEFLTPEEFRQYVGIGRATMYELLRRNEIPYVRFGRLIRIRKSVLDSFLAPSQ